MRGGRSRSRLDTLRLLWIVPLALALLYATGIVAIANIAYSRAPELVLKLYPYHGPALGALAFDRSIRNVGGEQGGPDSSAEGSTRRLAQQSLVRSPTTTSALRALALLAEREGDYTRATRLMSHGLALSRRDLPVVMWLIEARVREDDIPSALHLYDVALRTSRQAPSSLLPRLVNAAQHDWMLPYLVNILDRDPAWGQAFSKMLIEANIPSESKVALTESLRHTRWFGASFRHELVSNLVSNEEFRLAARLSGMDSKFDHQLNDAFDRPPGNSPFSWKLSAGYQIDAAFHETDGGKSIAVIMDSQYDGVVAKLLVLLAPGEYNLSSRLAGPLPALTDITWSVTCAQLGGQMLTELDLASARSEVIFRVPEGCQAQWLSLTAASTSPSKELKFGIADLSISER